MDAHSELPRLRASIRLQEPTVEDEDEDPVQWFDVKFCPYTEDPVFAVVGGPYTVICRCVYKDDSTFDILRVFEEEHEDESGSGAGGLNSLEWSQAENGDPLVCVSGPSQIKVLNVKTGALETTLVGHGANVNDLAISPLDPTILASCSIDHSIRIWSLKPAHSKQPTAAICYGQGHKDQILSIAYHRKGQHILSGGMDTRINLWIVPDDLEERMGTDKPAMVHYPHFSTTELHTDNVDCVRWCNDLVISCAARENTIQLWRIDNFSSDRPPPGPAPIPLVRTVNSHEKVTIPTTSIEGTRSAWGGRFQRLLQFDFPDHKTFYVRFSLFHKLGAHPILVAGNDDSRIFFWDLQLLEDLGAGDFAEPKKVLLLARDIREGSAASNNSGTSGSSHLSRSGPSTKGRGGKSKRRNRGIGDPFHSIEAHSIITVPKYTFGFHQFAWSHDGQWCVGVGDFSLINVLHRWEKRVPTPETSSAKKAGKD
ncbi:WD40 repeat-like protein [Lentithecium fluviatile CBS 122367]|uniref:WD40 repeat-like protein n=1 Tax=Lentithecium fluviatile CBS 122367 TaxID=1168545 RepID=A0A6G1J2Q6_9PLEO|nr:WD40 repeat-like protein [Lentithecium fluviatile CBS 122367]